MLSLILAAALIVVDQIVKVFVRTNIPLGGSMPFLPHVLELTYLQNTGAAFSLFETHTWILTLISAVAAVAILLLLVLKKGLRHPAGRCILAMLLAGTVGNLIDRAAFGYVTDMFRTLFMNFAIFNVADICLTVGCVLLIVYVLFFYDKLEKKGKKA